MLNKNGLTSQKFINLQIHFTILEHILNFFIHQKIFSCNFFSAFLAPYPTIVIKAKSIPERKFHNLLQQLKTSLLSPILILSFTNPNFYYIFQRTKPSFHWFCWGQNQGNHCWHAESPHPPSLSTKKPLLISKLHISIPLSTTLTSLTHPSSYL